MQKDLVKKEKDLEKDLEKAEKDLEKNRFEERLKESERLRGAAEDQLKEWQVRKEAEWQEKEAEWREQLAAKLQRESGQRLALAAEKARLDLARRDAVSRLAPLREAVGILQSRLNDSLLKPLDEVLNTRARIA